MITKLPIYIYIFFDISHFKIKICAQLNSSKFQNENSTFLFQISHCDLQHVQIVDSILKKMRCLTFTFHQIMWFSTEVLHGTWYYHAQYILGTTQVLPCSYHGSTNVVPWYLGVQRWYNGSLPHDLADCVVRGNLTFYSILNTLCIKCLYYL